MSSPRWLIASSGRDPGAWVVCGAMLFNWLLAYVNARGLGISATYVALCEVVLMASALVVVLRSGVLREQLIILCVYAVFLAFALLRFSLAQDIDLKPLRDVAIIFIFLCLGLSSRSEPYRLVYYAGLFIAAVAAVEMFLPEFYSALFNIKSYYINSRGYTEAAFWNPESDLFLSSTRPGSRFFLAFTNWPRASSIFLEPVSLGNFIIVSLMVLLTGWKILDTPVRIVWLAVLIFLLLLTDSRFAFACALMLIALTPLLRKLPQQLAFLLFAVIVGAGGVLVAVTGVSAASDDFLGRVFYTFRALQRLDVPMLLGTKYMLAPNFMDSGLTYFIVAQSLLAVIVLLLLYSVGIVAPSRTAKLYKQYVVVVLGLSLLISNSFFSIKTGALLWFCLGAYIGAVARIGTPARMYLGGRAPVQVG